MPKYHTVQQGEHLSSIALQYGFADYSPIWYHVENTSLRQMRPNPDILYPGDTVFIPELEEKDVSCATNRQHSFQLNGAKLRLRLRFLDAFSEPIRAEQCRLEIEGRAWDLNTDGEGRLEVEIPKDAREGRVIVGDQEIAVRIGCLDPSDETSGLLARLANLGYYRSSPEVLDEPELAAAIAEFQHDHRLKITGECDGATRAKLEDIYGC